MMNRRASIATLGLAAVWACLSSRANAAEDRPLPVGEGGSNEGIYRFRVGGQQGWVLQCGELSTVPGQPFMAPEATAGEFSAAVAEVADRTGRIVMPYNVLLLRWHARWVLIDAGPKGNGVQAPAVVGRLAQLGLKPSDIDLVVLTHAHFDHMGGLVSGGVPVFARAEHVVSRLESEFWTSQAPDCSGMRMSAGGMIADARGVLGAVGFRLIEHDTLLLPGLRALVAPGHTPGQLVLELEDAGERLYHISDLCHHAWLLLPHPTWTVGSDVNPAMAARTRCDAFRRHASNRARVLGFHLPFPGLGRIAAVGEGSFRWVPEDWSG